VFSNKKSHEQLKSWEEVEPIVQNFALHLETVLTRARTNTLAHKYVDVPAICASYIETLVNMRMPKKIAEEQYAIYKKIEDREAHLKQDEVAALRAELANYEGDYDLIAVRLQVIERLADLITDPAIRSQFLEIVGAGNRFQRFARQVGVSAVKGVQSMRAAFSLNT
jgi:hypothetical protein